MSCHSPSKTVRRDLNLIQQIELGRAVTDETKINTMWNQYCGI